MAHHVHEYYDDYLAGALSAELTARVEAHVRECPRCAEELAVLRQAKAILREPLEAVPPADLAARARRRVPARRPATWWPVWVGATAISLVVGVIVWHGRSNISIASLRPLPSAPTSPAVMTPDVPNPAPPSPGSTPEPPAPRVPKPLPRPKPTLRPPAVRPPATPDRPTVIATAPNNPQTGEVTRSPFGPQAPRAKPPAEWANPMDGAELVEVPRGVFLMGSDDGATDEQPRHKVYLEAFRIYRHPVTVKQYRQYCAATDREMPPAPAGGWQDDQPMVNVTWPEAVYYAEWAGARLPSEAEWEKHAGAGKMATPAIDEWCADWYDSTYYTDSPARNPQGPETGTDRVVRNSAKPTHRASAQQDTHSPTRGFRCVIDAAE